MALRTLATASILAFAAAAASAQERPADIVSPITDGYLANAVSADQAAAAGHR